MSEGILCKKAHNHFFSDGYCFTGSIYVGEPDNLASKCAIRNYFSSKCCI